MDAVHSAHACNVTVMELFKLTFDTLAQPALRTDDAAAIVWHSEDNKPAVIAKRVGEWCWFRIDGLATYRFPVESPDRVVRCVADPDDRRRLRTVVDVYYRSVVPLALHVYGLEAMHGTAVQVGEGTLTICGFSHAGKTTLTYAMERRGHRVLADDGVVIDPHTLTPGFAVQPIPFALMLREPVAEHFGTAVRERVTITDDAASTVTVPPVPLNAVVVLDRVDAGTPNLAALSLREAYESLLRHCYVFSLDDPARKGRMLSAYARFANTVPVYRFTYPNGMQHLDAAAAALEELAADLVVSSRAAPV